QRGTSSGLAGGIPDDDGQGVVAGMWGVWSVGYTDLEFTDRLHRSSPCAFGAAPILTGREQEQRQGDEHCGRCRAGCLRVGSDVHRWFPPAGEVASEASARFSSACATCAMTCASYSSSLARARSRVALSKVRKSLRFASYAART